MTIKMDPKDKARWVTDLRSGKYPQGKFYLRTAEDTFCCIGVYADQLTQDGHCFWQKQWDMDKCYSLKTETVNLNLQVVGDSYLVGDDVDPALTQDVNFDHFTKIELPNPGDTRYTEQAVDRAHRDGMGFQVQEYLAMCNDYGATFEQIADWIEENL